MNTTEAERAQLEARRDVEAHPERKLRHESAIGRYLAGMAYAQERPERKPAEAESAESEKAESEKAAQSEKATQSEKAADKGGPADADADAD